MMTKIVLNLALVMAMMGVSFEAAAQSDIALATKKAKLQALSENLKKRDENDRREAQEFARRKGIPVRRELPNGKILELQRISPDTGPVFYVTNNVDAADTVSTDEVRPGGSAGLDLDGGGMTVGQWDSGSIYALHPDFTGRLTQEDSPEKASNHSTHVAGTLIGEGVWYPESRGMAYAAHLDAYDWNSDTAEMASAASAGLLVSNHSYGIAAGWLYIGGAEPNRWWWIGGDASSDVEDLNFGYYDSETQLWDQIAFDAPYYLIVKATGNDRSDIGPVPDEEYRVIDQNGDFQFYSTLPRDADCAPAGYDCLPTNSVAKNVLTVGAVDDITDGYSPFSGPSSVQMTSFSGWGPTDDGRIKPDLVGNGELLFSAWDDTSYAVASGTSMATPNVTGSLLLLQEHYQDTYGTGKFMRAATLKALAIHTADEAGAADGPDYEYGWGLLNTKAAAQLITEDGGTARQIIEGSLSNGGKNSVTVTVSEAGDIITATLVWADPPGTPVTPPALDQPDSMLVNDLDLRITRTAPASTYLPWVLNPASPADAATTGDNFRDNVEQVVIGGGTSDSYSVEVSHKGTLLNGDNQNYSLIISIKPPPPPSLGLLIDEDFSGGMPVGWSVKTTSGVSWTINPSGEGNQTGGGGNFAMVDNKFINNSVTSLWMPTFDLSAAEKVTLRFNSCFYIDLLESYNVDVSTDGGSSWTNVWKRQGNFDLCPTNYSPDLTEAAAGQPSVKLRFRFDSEGSTWGEFWQIDDVELEVFGGTPPQPDLPGQATTPIPADSGSGLGIDTTLSWTAGPLATSHDVYFGASNPPVSRGNQADATFDPGPLDYATTYYWRVDEVNSDGATQGNTWSFTTEAAPTESINLAGLSGSVIPGLRGRWTAAVDISVEDQGDTPEADVTVEGSWSNGATGGATCTTDITGHCSVEKTNLKKQVNSVTFTVSNLTKSGSAYSPADNVGGDSIIVTQSSADQMPGASDDSYQTAVDTPVDGNVIANDDQGDGPASVSSNTLPSNGALSLTIIDGAFTYTPTTGFEGSDSFTYSIVDQDGDISNTATVSITVSGTEPPPSGELSVSLRPFKVKGVQHVDVTWQYFSGANVNINRSGDSVMGLSTENDGTYEDNIGAKGGGSYIYEVCEASTSNCASATTGF